MDYSTEWRDAQLERWNERARECTFNPPKGWTSPQPRFDFIQLPAFSQILGLLGHFPWVPPWQVAGEVLHWRHLFRIHNARVLGETARTGSAMCPEEGLELALLDLPLYAFRDALPLLANQTSRELFNLDAIDVDTRNGRSTMLRYVVGWLAPCTSILNSIREEAFCRGYAEVLPVMRFLHRCVDIDPDTVAVGALAVLAYNNKVKATMFAKTLPEYFREQMVHDITTFASRAAEDQAPDWNLLVSDVAKRERMERSDAAAELLAQFLSHTEEQIDDAASGNPVESFADVDLTDNEGLPDFIHGALVRAIGTTRRRERRRKNRERCATDGPAASVAGDNDYTVRDAKPHDSAETMELIHAQEVRDRVRKIRRELAERGDTVAVARLDWEARRASGATITLAQIAVERGLTVPQLKGRSVAQRIIEAFGRHGLSA